MNATLERLKQTQAQSAADAEAAFDRLATMTAADVAPSDPAEVRRILDAAGRSVADLEQRVGLISRRQKWIDELAAAEDDRLAADELGREYEEVAEELKRVSEPLRAKLGAIGRRKEELGKSMSRVTLHRQRLAETGPSWIAEARRSAGRQLTAKRERVPFVRDGIVERERRLAAIALERGDANAKIKPVTHPEAMGRDEQAFNNKQAEAKIALLDREKADVSGQLERLRAELPIVEQECRRLQRRVSLLDRIATSELWPIPSEIEERLAAEV